MRYLWVGLVVVGPQETWNFLKGFDMVTHVRLFSLPWQMWSFLNVFWDNGTSATKLVCWDICLLKSRFIQNAFTWTIYFNLAPSVLFFSFLFIKVLSCVNKQGAPLLLYGWDQSQTTVITTKVKQLPNVKHSMKIHKCVPHRKEGTLWETC
jgi:hypothetical protein